MNFDVLNKTDGEPSAIRRARQYIVRNYREDLSLSDVARALNIDVFYFCRLFKKSSGVGFAEYLGRLRIETAMELLANSELHISAIAFEVGFQALSSFNRLFRRFTRMSPTEYRTINRQKRK
jgi:AraC-like DNA-binding protein